MNYRFVLILPIIFITLLSCKTEPIATQHEVSVGLKSPVEPSPTNFTEQYLMQDMGPLDLSNPEWGNPLREWYFSPFKKNMSEKIKMYSGLYPSHGDLMAAHIIQGSNANRGTLIFIHGYCESAITPYSLFLAEELIPKGYQIILLNLPGHEFSGGNRNAIEDFLYYGDMVRDFLIYTDGQLKGNLILSGHSVGATAIYDALVRNPELIDQVDASILITPFSNINLSSVLEVSSVVVDKLIVKNNFMNILTEDKDDTTPLNNKYQYIPAGWIITQRKWSAHLPSYPRIDVTNMLILFGDKDIVIDVNDSYKYYKEKTNATIKMYAGQDHLFYNTSPKLNETNSSIEYIKNDILNWLNKQLGSL